MPELAPVPHDATTAHRTLGPVSIATQDTAGCDFSKRVQQGRCELEDHHDGAVRVHITVLHNCRTSLHCCCCCCTSYIQGKPHAPGIHIIPGTPYHTHTPIPRCHSPGSSEYIVGEHAFGCTALSYHRAGSAMAITSMRIAFPWQEHGASLCHLCDIDAMDRKQWYPGMPQRYSIDHVRVEHTWYCCPLPGISCEALRVFSTFPLMESENTPNPTSRPKATLSSSSNRHSLLT